MAQDKTDPARHAARLGPKRCLYLDSRLKIIAYNALHAFLRKDGTRCLSLTCAMFERERDGAVSLQAAQTWKAKRIMSTAAWPDQGLDRSLGAAGLREAEAHPCVAYPAAYPEGGPPMGAGFIHNDAAWNLRNFIQLRLQARGLERFRVATDVYLYASALDEEMQRAAPDVFVYLAIRPDRGPTGTFHAAFDGPPDLVIEILSRSTWTKDIGVGNTLATKKRFYQTIDVPEYWVYDPERLRGEDAEILEGFRLTEDAFASIEADDGFWYSDVLEAEWGIGLPLYEGADHYEPMRLMDPDANEWYPLPNEQRRVIDKQEAYIADLERRLGLRDTGNPETPEEYA